MVSEIKGTNMSRYRFSPATTETLIQAIISTAPIQLLATKGVSLSFRLVDRAYVVAEKGKVEGIYADRQHALNLYNDLIEAR
jgi:hypothetical protein